MTLSASVWSMWGSAGARASVETPEDRLIALAQRGDRDALGQIYRKHQVTAYTLALRICGHREQAHDIVQDSFLRAFDKLSSFRGDAPFVAWFKRIVANVAVESLRGGKARWIDDEGIEERLADAPDLAARHDALGLLAQLSVQARTVLVLYELEGYSHREIADLLGRTEVWSKTTLSRAKSRLSQLLDADGLP
jgi:RNA polymerase sigma factor (sigma-70 family)